MTVELAGKQVGAGNRTYITFECGPTHAGLDSAKRLADAVAAAGADAIKFQIIDADKLVADPGLMITYGILAADGNDEISQVTEPLIEPLRRRMLKREEWRELKRHCDTLGLAFFATVGFDDEVDFVREIGCHSIKIASSDIDHHALIEYAARSGLCIQLDTGHATIGEVEAAVDLIRRTGNESIIIHHCPTGYPARLDGINLQIIPTLRRMFDYPIAFSDHSPGWDMDIAAVALGANLIEKTITEDRRTPSIEHIMSIEPEDCARFVSAIREVEAAFGSQRRILDEDERKRRMGNRRSLYAARDLSAGTTLDRADVICRRPGFGIPSNQLTYFAGRALSRAVASGKALMPSDFA